MASVPALLAHAGPTTLVNVTGAVVLELVPPEPTNQAGPPPAG